MRHVSRGSGEGATGLRRLLLAPILAVALLGPLAAQVATSEAAPVVATVVPSTGLEDGQSVAFSLTGVQAEGQLWVHQCPTGADPFTDPCHAWIDGATFSAAGLERGIWVLAVLDLGATVDCRVAPGCELVVTVQEFRPGGDGEHRIPLGFDPLAPLRPYPSIGADPVTDLGLHDVIGVRARGLDPWQPETSVMQCATGDVPGGCDLAHHLAVPVTSPGALDIGWEVGTIIQTGAGDVDCRAAPGACSLVVGVTVGPGYTSPIASVPLSFLPGAAAGYPTADPSVVPPPTPPPVQPPAAPGGHGGTRYLDPVFDEVEVLGPVTFWPSSAPLSSWDGPLADLTLEIVQPVGDPAAQRPVLLTSRGDLQSFAQRGWVVVYVSQRPGSPAAPGPGSGVDATIEANLATMQQVAVDWAAAIRWLRAHADALRLHPDAFVASGFSRWGFVSFTLGWGQRNAADTITWSLPWQGTVQGEVALPGIDGWGGPNPEQPSELQALAANSAWYPLELIDPGEPPVIMHNGDLDAPVPLAEAEQVCPAAAVVGVVCELHVYAGEGHVFGDAAEVLAEDRTARFFYDRVLLPAGLVTGAAPPAVAPSTPPAPVAVTPSFTG